MKHLNKKKSVFVKVFVGNKSKGIQEFNCALDARRYVQAEYTKYSAKTTKLLFMVWDECKGHINDLYYGDGHNI